MIRASLLIKILVSAVLLGYLVMMGFLGASGYDLGRLGNSGLPAQTGAYTPVSAGAYPAYGQTAMPYGFADPSRAGAYYGQPAVLVPGATQAPQ